MGCCMRFELMLTESQSAVLTADTNNTIMVPRVGLEPTRLSALVPKTSVAAITPPRLYLERVARIELAHYPWQGHKLPLHHTRTFMEWRVGFEPTVLEFCRLLPLTPRPSPHVIPLYCRSNFLRCLLLLV